MADHEVRKNKTTELVRKTARVWSAVVIVLTLVIMAAHVIAPDTSPGYPKIELLLPTLMVLSVAGLAVAWRWETLGGAINLVLFLAMVGLYWVLKGRFFPLRGLAVLSLAVVPGILFLICGWRVRTESPLINP